MASQISSYTIAFPLLDMCFQRDPVVASSYPFVSPSIGVCCWLSAFQHNFIKPTTLPYTTINSHPCNTQIFLRTDPSAHSISNILISCRTTKPVWQLWSRHMARNKQYTSFIFMIKCRHLDIFYGSYYSQNNIFFWGGEGLRSDNLFV